MLLVWLVLTYFYYCNAVNLCSHSAFIVQEDLPGVESAIFQECHSGKPPWYWRREGDFLSARAKWWHQQVYAYVVPKVYVVNLVNLCEGTFLHRLTSANHIVTLADAIRVLARSVLNETVIMEVRRSHIVKDALKEARKAKFSANKLAKVILRLHWHEDLFGNYALCFFLQRVSE